MSDEAVRDLMEQLTPFRHPRERLFIHPAVHLYMDELHKICELLRSAYPTLVFMVGDWTFVDLDQFAQVTKEPVTSMVIIATQQSYDPSDKRLVGIDSRIAVNIEPRHAIIRIEDSENIQDLGVATRIGDILQAHRSGFPKEFSSPRFLFGVSIVTIILSITWSYGRWTSLQVQLIVFALWYMMWIVFWIAYLRRTSKVYPIDRVESPSFIQRNKDQLLLAAIVAFLSILGTILVTSLGFD